VVAACVWDHAGGRGPLGTFWEAARELDPAVNDESGLAGAREGHLEELLDAAGLHEIEATALEVSVEHETFDDWWGSFALGVGPAGRYMAGLDSNRKAQTASPMPRANSQRAVRCDRASLGRQGRCVAAARRLVSGLARPEGFEPPTI